MHEQCRFSRLLIDLLCTASLRAVAAAQVVPIIILQKHSFVQIFFGAGVFFSQDSADGTEVCTL